LELLTDCEVSLLADRRKFSPYGLCGGEPGSPGLATLTTPQGSRQLPGKCSLPVKAGSVLRIETPGGGGWGASGRKDNP